MIKNTKKNRNCTTIFMVPPFGVGKERLLSNGFIGAYLGDINRPDIQYERGVYFLFKPEDMMAFEDFLYEERGRGAQIVEDYDYEDGYVVVIYVLEEEFSRDYERFLKGEYSKFSRKFKERFPQTVIVSLGARGIESEELSMQHRVFNKDLEMKEMWEEDLDVDLGDQEVWSKPDTDQKSAEWLDIGRIKIDNDV